MKIITSQLFNAVQQGVRGLRDMLSVPPEGMRRMELNADIGKIHNAIQSLEAINEEEISNQLVPILTQLKSYLATLNQSISSI